MDVAVPPTGPVSEAVVSRDRPGLAWTTASTKAACHDGFHTRAAGCSRSAKRGRSLERGKIRVAARKRVCALTTRTVLLSRLAMEAFVGER